ncbi:hypothetical protein [Cyanothece sp. BG0011]|uniref:hypothetical protein n=1 Tax=Cyanothece sp. BG0011 TaxID=2082950 RepID=UPI001E60F471|nr:hypothetical protein [Cyanothece sp. BG0011]
MSYKQECFGFLLTIVDRWFPSSKLVQSAEIYKYPYLKEFIIVKLWPSYGQGSQRLKNIEGWIKNADGLSVKACGQEGAVSLG